MPLDDDDDAALLYDMPEAAEAARRFIGQATQEHYLNDEVLRAAVERKIEVIGEASRGISETTRKAHPEIPWQKIAATRHVLAHDYDDINNDIIWRIASLYVPDLIQQLKPLIPRPPELPQGI